MLKVQNVEFSGKIERNIKYKTSTIENIESTKCRIYKNYRKATKHCKHSISKVENVESTKCWKCKMVKAQNIESKNIKYSKYMEKISTTQNIQSKKILETQTVASKKYQI